MKTKFLFVIMSLLMLSVSLYAQEPESSSPMYDITIIRECSVVDLEGIKYEDCTIILKSFEYGLGVKVTIKDNQGKNLFKKTLKSYLYVFSSGQIQVGRPKFTQILITPKEIIELSDVRLEEDGKAIVRINQGLF